MKTKIKNILCLLALSFLLLSNVSFSQLKNFGIKAGLNLSDASLVYTNFSSNGNDNKTGFNAYLFYNFVNYKNLTLSGEAGYSQKGFNNEYVATDAMGNTVLNYTLYNRLHYVDINAIAQFILRNSSVSPYFSFGPVLSIYAGYNTSTSGSQYDTLILASANELFDDLKSPVLGLMSGIGIEINSVIPQTIITEIRYNSDLTNSFKNAGLNYERNYLWQFNLGIRFK